MIIGLVQVRCNCECVQDWIGWALPALSQELMAIGER